MTARAARQSTARFLVMPPRGAARAGLPAVMIAVGRGHQSPALSLRSSEFCTRMKMIDDDDDEDRQDRRDGRAVADVPLVKNSLYA